MDFNERFMDIRFKMKERDRLIGLKERVEAQLKELERRKRDLYEVLKKEERDVEKLEGMSLSRFIHFIKKDTEEVLFKEQQEAIAAKLKYDGACSELEALKSELQNITGQLLKLGDLQHQYNTLIREKEEYIKRNSIAVSIELEEVLEEQAGIKSRIKELQEAAYAGRELLAALDSVQESLDSAKSWGTYDMFGGGFISTMAKHSKLDEANEGINRAQSLLTRFRRELQDLGDYLDINIDIDSFLTFADYFFDGFFVDWAVQNRINEARERVSDTIYRVNSIITRVRNEINSANMEYEKLEKKRMEIVERA